MEYHIIIDFLITFTYSTRQNNQMMKKEGSILNWIIGSKKFEASFAASIYTIKNLYENEKPIFSDQKLITQIRSYMFMCQKHFI